MDMYTDGIEMKRKKQISYHQLPDGSVSFEAANTLTKKCEKAVDFFSILPNKRFRKQKTLFLYKSIVKSFLGHLASKYLTILEATTSHL